MITHDVDTNIELNGNTTYAFISSVLHDDYAHILEANDLAEIDREAWYPLQNILTVLHEIANMRGAMLTLVSIGIAAADNAELPAEVAKLSPGQFLKLYEQLYPARHRNGSPGKVLVELVSNTQARITLTADVPYPDDVMYGVFYGYMRRFAPHDFVVAYDEKTSRRDLGGSDTIINVSWES
ncbi:MAG: hypothetical protein OHK0046_32830 [Anaerolineae bacterium]